MMIPAELIERLRGRGYGVTARQLTDWRSKGLLPNLTQRGRGRGPGAIYFWPQPDIADHAATVCELLSRHSRTETALLGAWFAGYKIEPHRVREAWLARLASAEASIRREANRQKEKTEDLLGHWSVSIAKKQAASIGLPYQDLDYLFLEILNAVFNPAYRFVAEDSFGLIEIAHRFLSPKAALLPGPVPFSEHSFARAVVWIRENLSLASVQKLISSTSDGELLDGHRRWLASLKAVAWLAKANAPENGSVDIPSLGRQFAVVFGPYCMLALLYLARHGAGPMMDATVEMLEEFHDQVPDPSSCFTDKLRDFPGERLTELWRSFDYRCVFRSTAPAPS